MTEHPVPGYAAEDDGEPDADTEPTEHVEPVPDIHPDVADYQRAHAAAHGIREDGGGGGLSVGGPSPLVVSSGGGDDQPDTGQSGGRSIA